MSSQYRRDGAQLLRTGAHFVHRPTTNKLLDSFVLARPFDYNSKDYQAIMNVMNIYLDVDGVLVSGGKPAEYLDDFIAYLDSNYDGCVYWLTTHCQGSTEPVMAYMESFISDNETLASMSKFKPTKWNVSKTEGIDLNRSFLWFDDNLLYGEKNILADIQLLDNMILVDLKKDPYALNKYIHDFPIPASDGFLS